VPGGMFQGCINVCPASRIVYQDHKANGGTAKYIEGIETLIQAEVFDFKSNKRLLY